MRILIVDDDYVSRAKLKAVLSKYGDCDGVQNGKIAISIVESAIQEGLPYDIITIDINMPVIDGNYVLHEIKHSEALYSIVKNAKIIIVSKLDSVPPHYREFDAFCQKPVSAEQIDKVMKGLGFTS